MQHSSHFRNLLLIAAGLWTGNAAVAQECGNCDQATTVSQPVASLLEGSIFETQINTFTYSTQHEQALDVAEDGRVLVAWASRRQEAGSYGVFAQLVDGLGRPLGTELHINDYMPGAQFQPAVAFNSAGDAFVAWASQGGQDGHGAGVYLRKLSELEEAQGANSFGPIGGEVQINETIVGDQQRPALVALDHGGVVAVWTSHALDGTVVAMARVFDADGQPLGGEFRLGTGEGRDAMPTVTKVDGGFVASWSRDNGDGSEQIGVFARAFDAEGQAQGDEQLLVPGAIEPSLASNHEGRLAMAWMALDCQGEYRAFAQALNGSLELQGETWKAPAAPEGHYMSGASVAMAQDGRHVVAYSLHQPVTELSGQGKPNQAALMGQEFNADGIALGAPQQIGDPGFGWQDLTVDNSRRMAFGPEGNLALAWYGGTEKDGKGIGLTVVAPQGFAPEAPAEITPVAALDGLKLAQVREQMAPPEWDPNWVDDSHLPPRGQAGTDFGFQAFTSTGWNPPDPDLAVGPNHVVAVVNVDMRFFDKDGTQTFNTGLESWFNTNGFVFDPIALYDEFNDRYVVAAVEHNNGDFFNIAVSDDNDPNGTWYKYRFNVSSICGFIDFPNLGMSRDAYFLIADCFGGGGNYIHVMDKAPMLSGGAASINSIQASSGIISNGATRNYDNEGTCYTASTYAAGSPNLRLFAVTNPTGGAALSSFNINVGSFSNPPDAQQLGTSNRADTIDHRIKNGVKRDGHLYLCHNVANGGVARVRWYDIDLRGWPTSGNTPVVNQSGYVNPGSGIYTWFGDINVDSDGTMAIAYNRSSSSEYISIERTWREEADAAGTLRDFEQLQTSTQPETGSRWGDYSGLELDPTQDNTFWSHNEYRESSWRTWIGQIEVGDVNTLTLSITGGSLIAGQTNQAIVTGSTPFSTVYLYNGNGLGTSTVPQGTLGINNAKFVLQRNVNAAGNSVINRFLPASFSGRNLWLQAIDASGATSNVVITTVL